MSTAQLPESHVALLAGRSKGVLTTIRRDGRPQLSNVLYHVEPERPTLLVSVTADRAKTRNVRRDPRVAMHVTSDDFWSWVVADGVAELSAVASHPQDETVEELVGLYRALAGEHPDWEEYRAVQVAEQRLVLRLHVERTYGAVASG